MLWSCSSLCMFTLAPTTVHPLQSVHPDPGKCCWQRLLLLSREGLLQKACTAWRRKQMQACSAHCSPAPGIWWMVKKKLIWMVWKSIHPVSQRINYFFLVICCMLSWLCLPMLLWRNALDSQAVQIRTTLCADFLHHRDQRFSFRHFLSDCTCTFSERNPSLIYDYNRTENPVWL